MVLSSFLRPSLLPAVLSHSLHLPDSPSSGSIKSLLICSFLLIWIHTGPNCWLGSAKETRLNEVHKTHQQSLAVCVWPFRPGVRVYRCFHTHYAALFFTDYYFNLHRRSLSRTFTPHFHTVLLLFPFYPSPRCLLIFFLRAPLLNPFFKSSTSAGAAAAGAAKHTPPGTHVLVFVFCEHHTFTLIIHSTNKKPDPLTTRGFPGELLCVCPCQCVPSPHSTSHWYHVCSSRLRRSWFHCSDQRLLSPRSWTHSSQKHSAARSCCQRRTPAAWGSHPGGTERVLHSESTRWTVCSHYCSHYCSHCLLCVGQWRGYHRCQPRGVGVHAAQHSSRRERLPGGPQAGGLVPAQRNGRNQWRVMKNNTVGTGG